MAARRPLVLISGVLTELPPGDGVLGGEITAGSGLAGGGLLNPTARFDVNLAPNPSGLIFVNGALGIDGKAEASGLAAQQLAAAAYNLALSGPYSPDQGEVKFLDSQISYATVGEQLDSFPSGTFRNCIYTVQVARGNESQSSQLHLVHNNLAVTLSTISNLVTSGTLAAYSGALVGGTIELNAFPTTADATRFRILRQGQAY
jgi:hypothetical protein